MTVHLCVVQNGFYKIDATQQRGGSYRRWPRRKAHSPKPPQKTLIGIMHRTSQINAGNASPKVSTTNRNEQDVRETNRKAHCSAVLSGNVGSGEGAESDWRVIGYSEVR